jgi:hypothetical protein
LIKTAINNKCMLIRHGAQLNHSLRKQKSLCIN